LKCLLASQKKNQIKGMIKTYPSWCGNWLPSRMFLLCKLWIWKKMKDFQFLENHMHILHMRLCWKRICELWLENQTRKLFSCALSVFTLLLSFFNSYTKIRLQVHFNKMNKKCRFSLFWKILYIPLKFEVFLSL